MFTLSSNKQFQKYVVKPKDKQIENTISPSL